MQQGHVKSRTAATATVLVLVVAGCGGSSQPKTTATRATATPAQTTADPARAHSASAATAAMRATLGGDNHTPTANKLWSYTVRVTDASGKPLAGTVTTDFVFPGLGVVGKETPAVHPLKNGALIDSVTFPPSAVGHPLNLVTVVRTDAGSVALAWPVSVKR